ncbi:MAG: hypothetical protein Q8J69_07805 [Sphingobacteriaceae bacterium]|nr:hypothetical protein [Sphingobacteriaceae bacterium]
MTYGRTYDFTRYDDYVAYFKALAEDHPAFFHSHQHKSFFLWHLEDLDRSLNDLALSFPVLMIEEPESTYSDNGAGYVTENLMGAVVVIKPVQNLGDTAAEMQVKTECKKLALGVMARMYHDKYQLRITGFDPSESKGAVVGPVWDNCYGYRLEFNLKENSTDAALDPNDYTDTLVDKVLIFARDNNYQVSNVQAVFDTIYKLRRLQ